jgi:glycosyltransferase involved in cell wall biosynthesis
MKIGLIYGLWSSGGHHFDFVDDAIYSTQRGLTGSELSCFTLARELVTRGHEITLFAGMTPSSIGLNWHGVKLIPIEGLSSTLNDEWHAVYAWNDPGDLHPVSWRILRLCNLQINDFGHCRPGFDDYVDVWTSPSESHRKTVGVKAPYPHKFVVIPNGCDPSWYETGKKVQGRVIWASSPDRGLHHLLQVWPEIRRRVPEAHLRILYRLKPWMNYFVNIDTKVDPNRPDMAEFAVRALYLREALRRYEAAGWLGVEVCDSQSHLQMRQEWAEASVLAYPCDTALYTEGFSVSLMEACASGTLAITTDQDALGEVYGSSVPFVKAPVGERLAEFTDLVVRGLTDEIFRREWLGKSTALAKRYKWTGIAERVEAVILEARAARGWPC